MRRHLLALSLLCLLPLQAASAADAEAELLRWPNPWKVGQVLEYETEALDDDAKPGQREKTRTTDTTAIRITQATENGFLQEWRSRGVRYEVIEGDQAEGDMVRAAMKSMEDVAIEASLDKDGNYGGIRNLDALSARMRQATRPLLAALVDKEFAKQAVKVDEKTRADALKATDGMLERMFAPPVLAAMLGQVVETYNAFVGVEFESGQWYELETELDNPMGGPKFPAKLEFTMYPSKSDPDDVFFEWTSTIDPRKGAEAAWDLAGKLVGTEIPKEARKDLPKQIEMRDEGFALFRRDTGVTEMFETERRVKFGGNEQYKRHRMRLVGGDHDHAWKEDGDAEAAADADSDTDVDADTDGG